MKIELDRIKGNLRIRVDTVIDACKEANKEVIALFAFKDTDHEYSWRSKGKYIAVRWKYSSATTGEYHDTKIYY